LKALFIAFNEHSTGFGSSCESSMDEKYIVQDENVMENLKIRIQGVKLRGKRICDKN